MTVVMACSGCSAQAPVAPDAVSLASLASVGHATISGWAYETTLAGEPPVADAVIEVRETDGLRHTGRSAADGSYRVSVRPGWVTVTASRKDMNQEHALYSTEGHRPDEVELSDEVYSVRSLQSVRVAPPPAERATEVHDD